MSSARAHRDAVLALLGAVPHLTVYADSVPQQPKLPYAVVFWPSPRRRKTLMPGMGRDDLDFYVNAVGADANQALAVADRAHAALVDVRPTVPGRRCFAIESLASEPARPDYDVAPAVYVVPALYRLSSVPA